MNTRAYIRRNLLWAILVPLFHIPLSFSQNCLFPPPQLISWWGGEGNANDTQGTNPGTVNGNVQFVTGIVGKAFNMNGVDSIVEIPDSNSLMIRNAITIDLWVKPSNPTAADRQWIAGKYPRFGIDILKNGHAEFEVEITASFDTVVSSKNPLPANTFTHVTGTYDSVTGVQKIYINGVLDNTNQTSGMLTSKGGNFVIGGLKAGVGLNYPFTGLIDEIHVFNRALTNAEIVSIYNAGSAGLCGGGGGGVSGIFVPIVLSSAGLNNSFFTSEMALTSRGTATATLHYSYTAAFGGGSGTGTDTLQAGRQLIVSDAITYLKLVGVPIPDSGNRGGTLLITCDGIPLSQFAVTVRTTTAVANGRAGLAYAGIPVSNALTESSYICGLRQNATDRSNIAVQNAAAQGDIVLRVTVYSGDPAHPFSQDLPDINLTPGGFFQISGVLQSNGLNLTNGFARVSLVTGSGPYYAYGVINDQSNSDGSFIPPLLESSLLGHLGQTLPVIVETGVFNSELVATNLSASVTNTYHFSLVSSALTTADHTANFDLMLHPREQAILPDFVQYLRSQGVAGIPAAGGTIAGALYVSGDTSSLFLGARTSTPGGGGRYGLFYVAVPNGLTSTTDAWIYGLQQNAENRSNLGLVDTGETDGNADTFTYELYNGDTGLKAATIDGGALNAKAWTQVGIILTKATFAIGQGYVHVIRATGANPFITYGVENDGGQPGERTGDGAYIASAP